MNELLDADIAQGWIDMHFATKDSPMRDAGFWAYIALDDLCRSDSERCWKIIEMIRRLNDTDQISSNLAAGPLEDLLAVSGSDFIDRCEALAKTDGRFERMLGMVWKNSIPKDIWRRLQVASC